MSDKPKPERGSYGEIPGYPAYGYTGTQTARLPKLIRSLKRFWWVPVLTLAVAIGAASFYTALQPPAFVSSARLWVSGKLNMKENSYYSEELQFFFGTQIELLQSEKLQQAAQVRVQTLNPNLIPCPVKVKVQQAPKSSMFIMSATGEEPSFVQAYLNSLIDEYLTYKKQVRAGTSDETLSSLSEQVYQHEKDLKAEQAKLTAYQQTNNMAVLQDQVMSAGSYLGKLNAQLSDLKLESDFLGAMAAGSTNSSGTNLLSAAKSTVFGGPSLASAETTPELAISRQQLQLLKLQRDELTPFLRPKHPKIQKLDEDIARAEKMMTIYNQQSIEQIEPSRQARQLKIDAVEGQITEWEGKLTEANVRLTEVTQLKANVDRIQIVYDKLLSLLQTIDVNKSLDQEVVSVMEKASQPKPATVGLPRMVALACVVGLGVGLMLIFLVARFDDRFSSMNELTEYFEEEIVGQVPDVSRSKGKGKGKLVLVEPDDERHMFAESYRNIRSSILYMPVDNVRPKFLMVTSAIPSEGKSTVSANLARTMAFAGGRVLLIDGDMRRGKLHEYFGLERGAGFSKLLHEPGMVENYIVPTALPNLFLMPSGDPIPDSSECFLNPEFDKFLKGLGQRFDQIIIDTAPVFAADDAPTLAPKMDGVLFVVRGSFTRAAMARQALDILYQRQARILGLVFNRASTKAGSYYYYKYADYYYGGDKKNGKAAKA